MVDNAGQIDMAWLEGHNCIGITAGASAPEILVQEVVSLLQQHGGNSITEQEGLQENLSFPLPKGLK